MARRNATALLLRLSIGVSLCVGAIVSCNEVVRTSVSMRLPEGDADARARLASIEVEVWPVEEGACAELARWRREVCGQPCGPGPSPRDRGRTPALAMLTRRMEDGAWEPLEVKPPGAGPWEVVLRGRDAVDAAFLYGCGAVRGGAPREIPLWRPWCDPAACAAQYHPACPVTIECEAAPIGGDPEELAAPFCVALAPVVWTWEAAGVACPPPSESWFAPCRPARVACVPGMLAPEIDGVCPRTTEPACGGSIETDADCDGRLPGPCGACAEGAVTSCGGDGTAAGCTGSATCSTGGTWGECVFTPAPTESCDGIESDCDGIPDESDPDAVASCVGDPSQPAADRCAPSGCQCGDGPPCATDRACCGGRCVSTTRSELHCGACFRACAAGTTCMAGSCPTESPEPTNDGGTASPPACADPTTDCLGGGVPGLPVGDRCSASGACMCGGGSPCGATATSVPTACCGGMCVDVATSEAHCGMCDHPCGAGGTCLAGSCT